MTTSENGKDLIKKHEGLRLLAYLCPANVWTIGYGHTRNVWEGLQITEKIADQLLTTDLQVSEKAVNKFVKKPINQNQFDALVSFVFNLGGGAFANSTLLKVINKNPNDENIKAQFQRWIYAGGKPLAGLLKRRNDECSLYFKA